MSRRPKHEYQRHYTVSDPRGHPKGYTEYKVTAKFVSKTNPEDVKEIVVWKRYSDFKKLHGDLAYIHRNLFRRLEEFPPFPKAQVFGRFEPEVIEERRKAAETMLRFTVHIPALNNSPQLKDFFQGGEGRRPLEPCNVPSLPPPLIPVPSEGVESAEDALGSIAERGAECGAVEGQGAEFDLEPHMKEGGGSLPVQYGDEALDALFGSGGEEEEEEKEVASPSRSLLSSQELALFDPFSKEASDAASLSHGGDLAGLAAIEQKPVPSPPGTGVAQQEGAAVSDPGAYVPLATERIKQALASEAAGDYQAAFRDYQSGVDLLLQGLQGDPDPARREAVKKKTADYLQRAEEIFQQHLKHLQP